MPDQDPQTTQTPDNELLKCTLCENRAWRGAECPSCPLFQRQHYVEGIGSDNADYFCIAESPFIPSVSSNTTAHDSWKHDIERVIKMAFTGAKSKNSELKNLEGRYTYAIRCMHEKPVRSMLTACKRFFFEDIKVNHKKTEDPIMIFALGPAVLQALNIKFGKYADVQGQFVETTAWGKKVLAFPSMSKRQLLAKTGYYEVLQQHILLFLEAVKRRNRGETIASKIPIETLTKDYVFPKNITEVRKLVDMIVDYSTGGKNPDNHVISIDTETNTLFPHRQKLKILSLVVAWDVGRAASIPLEHPETPWTLEQVYPSIMQLLNSPKPKIFHNAKFDLKVLARKGWRVRRFLWDTMLGEHLLSEDKKGFYGLKSMTKLVLPHYAGYEDQLHDTLAKNESESQGVALKKETEEKLSKAEQRLAKDTGFIDIPLAELNLYGAIDADVTRQLYFKQREKIDREDQELARKRKALGTNRHFRELLKPMTNAANPLKELMVTRTVPVTRVLADMELYGVPVDTAYINDLAIEMDRSIIHYKAEIHTMIPPGAFKTPFNPNSAHQLRKVLFGTGYRHPETGKVICYQGIVEPIKTKGGDISTNALFLRSLKTQHDCVFSGVLLEYRAIIKARNTFVENIRVLSREDGRMHTTFHVNGTSTGRLCVSENTILDTDKGSFLIPNAVIGATILTHRGRHRKIKSLFYKGEEEMYRVELPTGESIEVTENHQFFIPTGRRRLNELAVGHPITTTHGDDVIAAITPIGIHAVWDIEVEEDHSYVAQGFVNHNSSSDENLQNIPLAIGIHNIKKMFIPSDRENMVIVNDDAKAAEVRLYAAYSGDKALITALNNGMDPHSFFSGMVYNPATILAGVKQHECQDRLALVGIDTEHDWSYADFENASRLVGTKENPGSDPAYGKRLEKLRKNMKRMVFGILYGASSYKVGEIVGLPKDQAQAIIDTLFKMFPTIPEYIQRTQDQLRFMGMVETFAGRRRRLDLNGLPPKLANKAMRQAVNFKIQSNSSEIVLDVLCDVDKPIRDMGGRLLITVHDSLVFELPKKHVHLMPDFIEEYGVKKIAQKYPWLPVPFKWDVTVGPSYGEQMSVDNFLKEYNQPLRHNMDDYLEHAIKQDFEEIEEN